MKGPTPPFPDWAGEQGRAWKDWSLASDFHHTDTPNHRRNAAGTEAPTTPTASSSASAPPHCQVRAPRKLLTFVSTAPRVTALCRNLRPNGLLTGLVEEEAALFRREEPRLRSRCREENSGAEAASRDLTAVYKWIERRRSLPTKSARLWKFLASETDAGVKNGTAGQKESPNKKSAKYDNRKRALSPDVRPGARPDRAHCFHQRHNHIPRGNLRFLNDSATTGQPGYY